MSQASIRVQDLSKRFCRDLKRSLWYGIKDLSSELLLQNNGGKGLRSQEFWALEDLSFDLQQGETLGVVGHNGAGKSTLLKLINGLIRPNVGSIHVRGRVGALIALGTGFNPILTGRENIYVNAAVLGLSRREVERRMEEIVDFAEIGDFIDSPVRTYSSGMVVRLGFSIASTMEPEVLLIDEVLSVGDASFRERCYARLNEYRRNGGSVIFVSHNSHAIEAVSDRVMHLDHGRLVALGEPAPIIKAYEQQMAELARQAESRISQSRGPAGEDSSMEDIRITEVKSYDLDGNDRSEFEFGERLEVRIRYEVSTELRSPSFNVSFMKGSYQDSLVGMVSMLWDGSNPRTIPERGVVRCIFEDPRLSPNSYSVHVGVQAKVSGQLGRKWYARTREYCRVSVVPGSLTSRFPGIQASNLASMPPLVMSCTWDINGKSISGQMQEPTGNAPDI